MSKNKDNFSSGPEAEEMKGFAGYTMDELKHQRALTLVKREFLKQKAMNDIDALKSRLPFNGQSPIGNLSTKGIFGKLIKGLSYMDYIMLGFSMFTAGRKIVSLFHRKK